MKIEIDFADLEEIKVTIGDRELRIERDGGVTTLAGVPKGLNEDSLGGIIAGALFSKIGDIAGAMEGLPGRFIDNPWAKMPGEISESVYHQID